MLGLQGRNAHWAKPRRRLRSSSIAPGLAGPLLLLALTGCGGGSEEQELSSAPSEIVTVPTTKKSGSPEGAAEKGSTESPAPKAKYIDRADSICADFQPKIDALEKEAEIAANEGDLDAAADQFEQGLTESDREIAALRDLPAPKRSEAALSRIYDGVEEGNRIFRRALDELRSGDVAGFNSLGDEARLASLRSKRYAAAFGFTVCGGSE